MQKIGLKHYKYLKSFIEYSNDMQGVYISIGEYNPGRKCIYDMIKNKKLNSIVNELFTKGRKLNISIVFIT